MREATGSAAAPAARCRKFRRGSFIFEPPFTSLDHLVGAWRSRPCFSTTAGDKVFSPLPVALVEGRRRAQPGTPNTLGARKAKVLHQVNQALAQSKIRRRSVDRFYARHFDLRQDRCRSFGRPHRRRLLRLCCKGPCGSHSSKQANELATLHSITSSAIESTSGGIVRPSALAVFMLLTS